MSSTYELVYFLAICLVKYMCYALILVVIGIFWFQRKLIYIPYVPPDARKHVLAPDAYRMQYELVTLRSADGTRIHGYWIPAVCADSTPNSLNKKHPSSSAVSPTLLYCHANAGNMGHRLPLVRELHSRLQCNIFIFSYRGYGHSEGAPSEAGLKMDAEAAFQYAYDHPQTSKSRMYLYGQSVGGAVAIWLARRHLDQVSHLIVKNSFLNLRKLIPKVMPLLSPLSFLCTEKWDSEAKMRCILQEKSSRKPFILLHSGLSDELVPAEHMQAFGKMLEESKEVTYRVSLFPFGTHNDTFMQEGYYSTIQKLVAAAGEN